MMRGSLFALLVLGGWLVAPAALQAQTGGLDDLFPDTTPPPTGGETGNGNGNGNGDARSSGLPLSNVRGGALGSRAPGNWISGALGRHNARQDRNFSPPNITRQASDLPPARRHVFMVTFLESMFDILNDLLFLFTASASTTQPAGGT